MAVRRLVHGMGLRYRLHVHSLPGRPDLVFPRLKKIVQIHGCFWHLHKGCSQSHIPKSRVEYWRPKLLKNKRRDKQHEMKLRALGWDLLTLWECELREMDVVSKRIQRFLS
jgi:DNA mismatch endonuclease, patch repair protein